MFMIRYHQKDGEKHTLKRASLVLFNILHMLKAPRQVQHISWTIIQEGLEAKGTFMAMTIGKYIKLQVMDQMKF